MIFTYASVMKTSLRRHVTRTTNAVESFQNVLYGVILKEEPLAISLPQILQYCRSDERDLVQFYQHGGLRTTYERKARIRPFKAIGSKFYKESDSRAPDFTEALLASSSAEEAEPTPKRQKVNDSSAVEVQ